MWELELRHQCEISLSRQIYLSFQERILSGLIAQGEALPSTRQLAQDLAVSRNTVCEAYDMLWTEGFLIRSQGAPTRVAQGLAIRRNDMRHPKQPPKEAYPIQWDFQTGQPDVSLFPLTQWSQIIRDAADALSVRQLQYGGGKGDDALCEEIARYLLRSRGITVDPADVFITSGATQALHLLVDILHKEDCTFALECPSHPGIRNVIVDKGYPLCYMPVDRSGADISVPSGQKICAVYVTPSHQFPLGCILPATRRAALIRLAMEQDFYIIEDDYDSEFRYSGPPISPIYSMEPSRVVYVGTFSKSMFPALRLGFAVLPKQLQAKWRHSRKYMDVQNPVLEQAALCEFLRSRKLDRYVQRMRRSYSQKREVLLGEIRRAFGADADIWGDASGLHMALELPGMEFGEEFLEKCRDEGMRIVPVSHYCPGQEAHKNQLLIGYGHLTHAQIEEGVRVLHRVISDL